MKPRATSTKTSSGTDTFIKRLGQYRRLGAQEETQAALEYRRTGDAASYHRLVESHLPLVITIARGCCFRPSALPDLVQEGTLGLMKAVTKYDPDRGVRLSTYAAWWIKAYIYQYCLTNGRIMRVATTLPQRRLFFALRKEQARQTANGERSDAQSIAQALNVPVTDVVEMEARLNGRDVQFDPSGADDLATDAPSADELLHQHAVRRCVQSTLEQLETSLGERDKAIIEQRLTADEPLSLQDLGQQWGISRERVRQLEQRLKKRLQPHLASVAGADSDRPMATVASNHAEIRAAA